MLDVESQAPADEQLVRACVAGDRQAFDRLVERHQRQVYGICYRFVGNHADASELAQDAFVRAYRALSTFEEAARFTTWLYRIAVNVCLNRLALKRPVHQTLESVPALRDVGERPDARLLREERATRVRDAIARLPEKQRATVILRIYHDLPHERIAAILGSSVGAAKANLFHALANLRRQLSSE